MSGGPDADREGLLRDYRRLVDVALPAAAREGRWVVRHDHCFGRILLDHAVGARWYDVLERGRVPAYRQLDDAQLAGAVAMAREVLARGDDLLVALDAQSLAWRGKAPKRRPAASPAATAAPGRSPGAPRPRSSP